MNELSAHIEALLFHVGEPLTKKRMSDLFEISEHEIDEAIEHLRTSLRGRGVVLMKMNDTYELKTVPSASWIIQKYNAKELEKPIGKAGAEVLSVVLYRGPATRSEIDYIRGVNSTSTLRGLLIRGLIEKVQNPKNKRGFMYRATGELLAHLGIADIKDLPEYEKMRNDLRLFEREEMTHADA